MITRAKEILTAAKDKMSHAVTHLDEELKTYRAGKANPLVFNSVMVDYYGIFKREENLLFNACESDCLSFRNL